jgi:hypothetical protein
MTAKELWLAIVAVAVPMAAVVKFALENRKNQLEIQKLKKDLERSRLYTPTPEEVERYSHPTQKYSIRSSTRNKIVLAMLLVSLTYPLFRVLQGRNRPFSSVEYYPAKIEESGQKGVYQITLTEQAIKRLGIETAPVREEQVMREGKTAVRKLIPYSAIFYDASGNTWTYTSPQPLVFQRMAIAIENIDGAVAVLSEGPPPGVLVVTVGVMELYGIERKWGD